MTMLRSPLRTTVRPPLRGPLESKWGGSPLSINAPAYSFLAGAQDISLYDWLQNNLMDYSADLREHETNTAITTATTVQDNSGVSTSYIGGLTTDKIAVVAGREYEFYVRVLKDAGTGRATLYGAFVYIPVGGTHSCFGYFDYADGTFHNVTTNPFASFSVDNDGTHWIIRAKVVAETNELQWLFYPCHNAAASFPDTTTPDPALTYTATITKMGLRTFSSPDEPSDTTGTAVAPVASYGDIQFADSEDDGTGTYTVDFAYTDSDGTVAPVMTWAAALSLNSGADASDAFNVTNTIEELNDAMRGMTFNGWTNSAWAELTISGTRVSDGKAFPDKVILVQSFLDTLDTADIADSTAIGTTIEDFGQPPGALNSGVTFTVSGSQTYLPEISNVAVSNIAATTADVDLDVHMLETTLGTYWWFISTSATIPSIVDLKAGTGSIGAGGFGNEAISNADLLAPYAQTTANVTGMSASTTYYVHVYCEDANGASADIESQQPTPTSFATIAAVTDKILIEIGDALLLETGDAFLLEA